MDQQKQELVEKLKSANNILVTVSSSPSVDQLAACIGMTLLLNKLKKHATAVFSGEVPSTIEFLKPEETIEKNTDSLRDFIISLDKSKADKLRYKVEDNVVKIFITPYKTSINEDDLDFSQGDFNVDVVLCLGVNQQQDLDQAITAHGRILHDAVVASINTHTGSELGTINWTDPMASSLSELVTLVCDDLGKELLDAQIATALLTGIVAETGRFSNEKTSPVTMRLSAELMGAGANQQLVANELEIVREPLVTEPTGDGQAPAAPKKSPDGTLEITHADGEPAEEPKPEETPSSELPEPVLPTSEPEAATSEISATPASRMVLQPPSLGGTLTANSDQGQDVDLPDFLTTSVPNNEQPILSHTTANGGTPSASNIPVISPQSPLPEMPAEKPEVEPPADTDNSIQPAPATDEPAATSTPVAEPPKPPTPEPKEAQIQIDSEGNLQALTPAPTTISHDKPSDGAKAPDTLSDLEQAVNSPHLQAGGSDKAKTDTDSGLEAARDAVTSAINSAPPSGLPQPKADVGASGYLNVQDLPGVGEHTVVDTPDLTESAAAAMPIEQPPAGSAMSLPAATSSDQPSTSMAPSGSSNTPPPVPPPLPLDDLSKFTNPSAPSS